MHRDPQRAAAVSSVCDPESLAKKSGCGFVVVEFAPTQQEWEDAAPLLYAKAEPPAAAASAPLLPALAPASIRALYLYRVDGQSPADFKKKVDVVEYAMKKASGASAGDAPPPRSVNVSKGRLVQILHEHPDLIKSLPAGRVRTILLQLE